MKLQFGVLQRESAMLIYYRGIYGMRVKESISEDVKLISQARVGVRKQR